MNPRKIMFTLYAESYVCYAQCIQQLPPVEERLVIFTIPSLTGLHDQTAWIIISALINPEKPVAWKKLNAFHYSTETWSDSSVSNNLLRLPGFCSPFRLDRNWHGGRVLAYVKCNIFCQGGLDLECARTEMLWLECRTSKNISILIAVCCQPPGLDTQSKQHYCDSFCCALTLLPNTHLILVAGDFNDPSLQRPPHRQSSLSRVLSYFGLQHWMNEPTR